MKTEITLFNEVVHSIASAEFIAELGKKYPDGLYMDIDNIEERKFAKAEVSELKKVIAKINRARIDHKKAYNKAVDDEAAFLISEVENASKNITVLVDAYNEKRAIELAAKKARELQKEIDLAHENAILMDEVESLRAYKAKMDADEQNQKEVAAREEAIRVEAERLSNIKMAEVEEKLKEDHAREQRQKEHIAQSYADKEKREEEERRNNVENQKLKNNEAMQSLLDCGAVSDPEQAKFIVKMIARDQVKNITINY